MGERRKGRIMSTAEQQLLLDNKSGETMRNGELNNLRTQEGY